LPTTARWGPPYVTLAVIGASALALSFLGVNPLLILATAGAIAAAPRARRAVLPAIATPLALVTAGTEPLARDVSLAKLFLVFLKAGSVVFGSGYVLLAFLRGDLVERLRWLTESQLVDAVAIGQVTPGPVFTTATFVGYVLHGTWGAIVATVGIFLPSVILVAVSGPFIPRLRRSAIASGFLDGVNVASLALMAAVSVQLARASVRDVSTALIALASLALLVRFRVNSTWLVLGGAIVGLVLGVRR
jgi:chromate transporter